MQLVIVIIVLALAIAYVAYSLYKAFTHKADRCYGCPLKEACKKQKQDNENCSRNKC